MFFFEICSAEELATAALFINDARTVRKTMLVCLTGLLFENEMNWPGIQGASKCYEFALP